MCFFHKKTLVSSGIFRGFTDYHSHILPGVDDGISHMEDALAVLKYYEEIGVENVWCTPHIMEDIPNTTAGLRKRFEELKAAYNGQIKLHLAAENMLDELFEARLSDDDVLPLGEAGNYLLVETSYFTPPFNMDETLKKIKGKGYFPILAHPERYVYMDNKDYKKYHEMGVMFQLNVTSLSGGYGKAAQKKAEWLLKHGMYGFYGSDLHSLRSFQSKIQNKVNIDIPNENQI